METTYTTKEAARALGMKPASLVSAIWNDQIKPPKKHGRNYLWLMSDIESASWALRRYRQFKRWEEVQVNG